MPPPSSGSRQVFEDFPQRQAMSAESPSPGDPHESQASCCSASSSPWTTRSSGSSDSGCGEEYVEVQEEDVYDDTTMNVDMTQIIQRKAHHLPLRMIYFYFLNCPRWLPFSNYHHYVPKCF